MNDFASRLQAALSARGLTQAALADAVGVTAAAVSTWMRGTVPARTRLQQVAEALEVPPRFLLDGEGTIPIDVEGLRDAYRGSLTTYARPTPPDGGREFGNVAEHAFELDLRILAREVGQNSGDAATDDGSGVSMVFTVIELSGSDLADFQDAAWWRSYRRHLEAASRETGRKAARQIAQALKRLDEEERLLLLRIDDYGAGGLTGPEYGPGAFTAVLRNQLDSQKSEGAGGSFGLGKNAMWGCSEFSLVLAHSRLSVSDAAGTQRFFGRGQLPAHTIDGVDYAGPVWVGRPDDDPSRYDARLKQRPVQSVFDNPVLADDLFLRRDGDDPGTSFLIVGFFDPSGEETAVEGMAERLAESMARNFWAAMTPPLGHAPRLRVEVRTQYNRVQKSSKVVAHGGTKPGFVDALEKHYAGDTVDRPDLLEKPGDVLSIPIPLSVPKRLPPREQGKQEHEATLLIRLAQPDEADLGSMAQLRGSLMTICEKRIAALPVGAPPFHAVLLAGGASGDNTADLAAEAFLRASEPPAHDKWTATGDLTTSYARGARQRLEDFRRAAEKAVREALSRPSMHQSDGPEDLKRLLRLGAAPVTKVSRPQVKEVSGKLEAGAWVVQATISLPSARQRGITEWRLVPTLKFATDSGAAISVDWADLEAVRSCTVQDGRLVAPPGTRTLVFKGRSDPSTHPVEAHHSKALIDVRAQEGGRA
ncbi:helix-turn-helix domain-containing protein [Kineococcus terrestris]|uniref:helix-turn-helix domain-containing protein n=1 Tax=Kineococcus terrestris TaxID=2044856 RepID=UPI0034DB6AF1